MHTTREERHRSRIPLGRAPVVHAAAMLWGLVAAAGCTGTSGPAQGQKDAEVQADLRSSGGDARADLPRGADDGPRSDSARDLALADGPPPPPDLGPCVPVAQLCEPDRCGVVGDRVCLPDGGNPSLVNRWCGACPDCPDLAAQLNAIKEVIGACSAGDTCALSGLLPCGFAYRVGADLTAYEALATTYNQRCVDPSVMWSCLEWQLVCEDGRCI